MHQLREPTQPSYSDSGNPLGLNGIEFIEYTTPKPYALGQVLEMMGFQPLARHRSREVLLYRQGDINIVVNSHPTDVVSAGHGSEVPAISAIALRVQDARAAYELVRAKGAWDVPTHAEVMELNIPAIHGVGASRIYFVDRYREFSIYDVDFVPIPTVKAQPAALAGLSFFGVVQYIGSDRSHDWIEFYRELFGFELVPDDKRFGIMPKGKLMRAPATDPACGFMLQLVEPDAQFYDTQEQLQRIGIGVPDVLEGVRVLRQLGMEFVETPATHTESRGAITKAYLGSITFELVHTGVVAP